MLNTQLKIYSLTLKRGNLIVNIISRLNSCSQGSEARINQKNCHEIICRENREIHQVDEEMTKINMKDQGRLTCKYFF